MDEVQTLFERAGETHDQQLRHKLRREFCRWIEDEFAIEEYEQFLVCDNSIVCVVFENSVSFASIKGEAQAAKLLVRPRYCCGQGDDDHYHLIGTIRTLADLGAMMVSDVSGQLRFKCEDAAQAENVLLADNQTSATSPSAAMTMKVEEQGSSGTTQKKRAA